jgi:hypothetical protein
VFADDSSQIIDGNSFTVYGNIQATTLRTAETKIALGLNAGTTNQGGNAIALGLFAGNTNQGGFSIAVGRSAGETDQGSRAIAIGQNAGAITQGGNGVAIGYNAGATTQAIGAIAIGTGAGETSQGVHAIAIGTGAGGSNQPAYSIILNATGTTLIGSAAGFYVDPIRSTTGSARPVVYDTTTKELFYTSTLEFINSTISTSDSSSITVDVLTTFNSDVVVENELTVSNGIKFSDGSVLRSYSPVTVIAATTTAQTVNDAASASYIQFVETVDTAGAYSPGVFTAPYTGYYQVNLSLYFSTTVTLNPGSFFLIDSNPDVVIFSGAWTGSYLHYSTVIPATAGDTIGFVFRQVSGAAIDIASGSRLTIHRVSIGA